MAGPLPQAPREALSAALALQGFRVVILNYSFTSVAFKIYAFSVQFSSRFCRRGCHVDMR